MIKRQLIPIKYKVACTLSSELKLHTVKVSDNFKLKSIAWIIFPKLGRNNGKNYNKG